MNILGREINKRRALWITIHLFVVVDIILICVAMLSNLPEGVASFIQAYDFCICVVLLAQWFYIFYLSKPKKIFLKQKSNWIDLIASIPFDVILPALIPQMGLLKYLRLLKLLRVIALFNRLYHDANRFVKKTNLDIIMGAIFIIVVIFTALMYILGPTYNLFDDFYFVVVTLATVGYGDVVPKTFNEKVITIILIIIGVFVFSTITAAISSFLTDRLLVKEEDDIGKIVEDNVKSINEELDQIKAELEITQKQNRELKDEILELKEMIGKREK